MVVSRQRPALGQSAELGALYDARTDSFIGISLLHSSAPASAISVVDNHRSDVCLSRRETYREKLSRMNINSELGASFLSGMIDARGSGSYLTDVHESDHDVQMSLHYSITTVDEKLNFSDNELKRCLRLSILESGAATHVVAGISWGARSILTAKHRMSNNDDRTKIEGRIQAEFTILMKIAGKAGLEKGDKENRTEMSFDFTVYGDVLANDGLLPTDHESAYKFISNVPRYIASANGGKGKPIAYTLLPLDVVAYALDVEIKADVVIERLSVDCLERFVVFFDHLSESKQKLNDHYSDVQKHKFCVPAAHRDDVATVVMNMKVFEAAQKSSYAHVLKEVRSGHAQSEELWQLLEDSSKNEDMSPERIELLTNKYCSKMKFADLLISKGARYIGDDVDSLSRELTTLEHDDAYVFFLNEEVMHKQSSWEGNQLLLGELLKDTEGKKAVIIVDRDTSGAKMEKSYISLYRNWIVVVEDLLEQNELMADKSFARQSDEKQLDESSRVEKPQGRSPVRIPCPGRHCIQDGQLPYDWICFKCHAPLEYADHYIYCECGRAPYSNYEFRCKERKHGSAFVQYNSEQLLTRLDALEPFPELNILILGETGVGKSTFINAFINYLSFDTLDDALKDEKLHWVIPCSFSTQTLDPTDPSGKWVERHIWIGQFDVQRDIKIGQFVECEDDGTAGQSATQKTTVYPVVLGDTIVRLIDTPGICDTRGVEQDKKNMANILGTLSNFSNLHGVLFLLKPNDTRLSITFRFCMEELLTHLHRDAVKNMVFGFTTTRISNFKPSDSFKPLQTLLRNHNDVGIALTHHNVYCYDSESFRYLAARKSGVEMDNIDDFRRSWKHSRDEALRLVKYVGTLRPHLVRSTISLNGTREMIKELTKPIAEIIQTIETSIRDNQANVSQLQSKKVLGVELQLQLHVQKVEVRLNKLEKPRTVCSDKACVEHCYDSSGEKRTVHKSICHEDCYVQGAGISGSLFLIGCRAMSWSGYCKKCGHYYLKHEHVRYEFYEERVSVTNSAIQEQLEQNATDVTLKENAVNEINAWISKARDEHEQMKAASVKLGLYLKKNSIALYNDAMLEYLDHQIQEESDKVTWEAQNGRNGTGRKRLDGLRKCSEEYKEQIKVLEKSIADGGDEGLDEGGVDKLVQSLYSLPLWGQNLKEITTKAASADRGAYREKSFRPPYRVIIGALRGAAEEFAVGVDTLKGVAGGVAKGVAKGVAGFFQGFSRR